MPSIIVAISQNQSIGEAGKLPWHLPSDLKRFKQITWGKTIIMGRGTFESIGKPLPGRKNIVISRTLKNPQKGITVCPNIASAFCQSAPHHSIVIGGGKIYAQTLPLCQKIYLTIIKQHIPGDTFFPPLHMHQWRILESAKGTENNHPYHFYTLCRK